LTSAVCGIAIMRPRTPKPTFADFLGVAAFFGVVVVEALFLGVGVRFVGARGLSWISNSSSSSTE
jgi:hypothetical protein